MFKSELVIRKVRYTTREWQLDKPLIFYSDYLKKDIVVPKGFITDLTTGWIDGRNTEASVVHDYLLDNNYGFKKANIVMSEALITLKVRKLHKSAIMFGVNTWKRAKRLMRRWRAN